MSPKARSIEERGDVARGVDLSAIEHVARQERRGTSAPRPARTYSSAASGAALRPRRGFAAPCSPRLVHDARARARRLAVEDERDARHLRRASAAVPSPSGCTSPARRTTSQSSARCAAREAARRAVGANDAEIDASPLRTSASQSSAARAPDDELDLAALRRSRSASERTRWQELRRDRASCMRSRCARGLAATSARDHGRLARAAMCSARSASRDALRSKREATRRRGLRGAGRPDPTRLERRDASPKDATIDREPARGLLERPRALAAHLARRARRTTRGEHRRGRSGRASPRLLPGVVE